MGSFSTFFGWQVYRSVSKEYALVCEEISHMMSESHITGADLARQLREKLFPTLPGALTWRKA